MYRELAPAKINLYLHVTAKRHDGYHLLDSFVVFTEIGDVLTYAPSEKPFSLELQGPFASSLADLSDQNDNLVIKGAQEFFDAVGDKVGQRGHFVLKKNLPVASGIGGGSADAAAALRLLHRCWGVDVPREIMMDMAYRLGADVPVCYQSQACRMQGIGEELSPVPQLPICGIILVNCMTSIATPAIFKARKGGFAPEVAVKNRWTDYPSFIDFLRGQGNSLEQAAFDLCPQIEDVISIIADQNHCDLARMSGSGATCFGLFSNVQQAQKAAESIKHQYPQWWIWGGGLHHA